MNFKLGRKARTFDPRIKKMRAVFAHPPIPPVSIDWTHGITDFGMMMNDTLGCCTCAAVYHARQIWTANALTEKTEADNCVLKLYEEATGYNPADPNTDQGGIEQNVLRYLLNTGFPLVDGTRNKISAFLEVDHNNVDDVKTTISDFGVAYIGFQVPNTIYTMFGAPKQKWEVEPGARIEGGHAVVLVAYDAEGPTCVSWGSKFKMTWEFFSTYTDEVYAIVDNDWIATSGKTPLGMDVNQLETLMEELR